MKLVEVRYKNGINRKIRETMKTYIFICPQKDITVGEYVLVESKQGKKYHNNENFRVARVERIIDDVDNSYINEHQTLRFVVCKLAVKDFQERCLTIQKFKRNLRKTYLKLNKGKSANNRESQNE